MNHRLLFFLMCLLTARFALSEVADTVTNDAQIYIVGDTTSQTIISSRNASKQINPGPLVKLMSIYVIFDALQSGVINLGDEVEISSAVASTSGIRMFLTSGDKISVDRLIKAAVISGANDAILALVATVAGTETNFVAIMNQHAKSIRLTDSKFTSALGYNNNSQFTTASDLYQLAYSLLLRFPEYYSYFNLQKYDYQGIVQYNPNDLLARDAFNDGLLVAETPKVGSFGIISSMRNERRILAVVGHVSHKRALGPEAQRLINFSFEQFTTIPLTIAKTPLTQVAVREGTSDFIGVGTYDDISITIPRATEEKLEISVQSLQPLMAPVKSGDVVAKLVVQINQETLRSIDLHALNEVDKEGVLSKGWKRLKSALSGH
ncbi:MAG: D-alanyl-D-alanine carboxypeptidase [Burkholderiales bacterium]|nr:D-alanyl-D-alanine carboxypeptidase [Burkholderiales bacterium]